MIKDLESDCITCSLFIEIYIIIQRVLSWILFDWIEVAVKYINIWKNRENLLHLNCIEYDYVYSEILKSRKQAR